MRASARILGALLLAAAVHRDAAAQTSSRATELLTIDAAISLALAQNRELAGAALSVENADDAIAIARTRRFPQFDIDAQVAQQLTISSYTFPAGAFGVYEATGPIPAEPSTVESSRRPTFYANATIAQPLTQLFRLNIAVDASETARDIERERLRSAEQKVATEVRRVYYAVLQADRALMASAESIAVAEEYSRVMRVRCW